METITLQMDQERELKWTFAAIRKFEKQAREILKRLEIKDDKGRYTTTVHTGYVLANFGKISEIMEAGVSAAAGISMKGDPSEASKAIDAYLDSGGSLEELQRSLYRAYLVANDPSSIVAWEAAIQREEEIQKLNQEKVEIQMEIKREELKRDQERLQALKNQTSGNQPSASLITS